MAQSLYVCRNCKKQFKVKDSETYKFFFYVFLWMCVFVTIFVITVYLLFITIPFTYYFYNKHRKLKGKKFNCPFCKKEMERTGMEESEQMDFIEETV